MKAMAPEEVERMREYARLHPEITFANIAVIFEVSEITVKRYCRDLRRAKTRHSGRPRAAFNEKKFWARVTPGADDECWPWNGCKTRDGYGFMYKEGRSQAAHRIAYELTKGPIPSGRDLHHRCDNRPCCNPEHLEPVTHRENMELAGILPASGPATTEKSAASTDTQRTIDTDSFETDGINKNSALPLLNQQGISIQTVDTSASLIPAATAAINGDQQPASLPVIYPVTTPRPRRTDLFAPVCTMEAPPELESIKRTEGPSGTREDLGISDWSETEYGNHWWSQSDEQLRERSIHEQTEAMRKAGEFLHWYRVTPVNSESMPQHMSARTGPEACIKVERMLGKGWARSWSYFAADPYSGPYSVYLVILKDGAGVDAIGRTGNEAIAMVEAVFGTGHVLSVQKSCFTLGNGCPDLKYWIKNWRRRLEFIHQAWMEKHNRAEVP